jgi:hypothetical protein
MRPVPSQVSEIDESLMSRFTKLRENFRRSHVDLFREIEVNRNLKIEIVEDRETAKLKFKFENPNQILNFDDFIKLIFSLDFTQLNRQQQSSIYAALDIALKHSDLTLLKPDEPETNPLIWAFVINNANLAITLAKSTIGFDLLQDASSQMQRGASYDKILMFLLNAKSPAGESLLELAYKGNINGNSSLAFFVLNWSKLVLKHKLSQDAEILKDVFINFINRGKDAELLDLVQIISEKIKTSDSQDKKRKLVKILIDTLDDIKERHSDIFTQFAYRIIEEDKENLRYLMTYAFHAKNFNIFHALNEAAQERGVDILKELRFIVDNFDIDILSYCCKKGNIDQFRMLTTEAMELQPKHLLLACQRQDLGTSESDGIKMIKILLEKGLYRQSSPEHKQEILTITGKNKILFQIFKGQLEEQKEELKREESLKSGVQAKHSSVQPTTPAKQGEDYKALGPKPQPSPRSASSLNLGKRVELKKLKEIEESIYKPSDCRDAVDFYLMSDAPQQVQYNESYKNTKLSQIGTTTQYQETSIIDTPLNFLCGVKQVDAQCLELLDKILASTNLDINHLSQDKYPALLIAYTNNNRQVFTKILQSQYGFTAINCAMNFLKDSPEDLDEFVRYLFTANSRDEEPLLINLFSITPRTADIFTAAYKSWIRSIALLKDQGEEFRFLFDNFIVKAIAYGENLDFKKICGLMIEMMNSDKSWKSEQLVTVFSNFIYTLLEKSVATEKDVEFLLKSFAHNLSPNLLSHLLGKFITRPDLASFTAKEVLNSSIPLDDFVVHLEGKNLTFINYLCCVKVPVENIELWVNKGLVLKPENLVYACRFNNEAAVKFLLEKGLYQKLEGQELSEVTKYAKKNKQVSDIIQGYKNAQVALEEEEKRLKGAEKKRLIQERKLAEQKQQEENQRINIGELQKLLTQQGFEVTQQDELKISFGEFVCHRIPIIDLRRECFAETKLQDIVLQTTKAKDADQQKVELMIKQCDKIECLAAKLQDKITNYSKKDKHSAAELDDNKSAKYIVSQLNVIEKKTKPYSRAVLEEIDNLFKKSKGLGIAVSDQDLKIFTDQKTLEKQLLEERQQLAFMRAEQIKQEEIKRRQDADTALEISQQRELALKRARIENGINVFYNELQFNFNKENFDCPKEDFQSLLLDQEKGINPDNITFHQKRIEGFFAKSREILGRYFVGIMADFLDVLNETKDQLDKTEGRCGLLDFVDNLFSADELQKLGNLRKDLLDTIPTMDDFLYTGGDTIDGEEKSREYQKRLEIFAPEEISILYPPIPSQPQPVSGTRLNPNALEFTPRK